MTKIVYLFFILLFIGSFPKIRSADLYDVYQLISYLPSIGTPITPNVNSYSQRIYFSTMNECNDITATYLSQLTIGTWLKFDTRATADVDNIGIFYLWSTQSNVWLHILWKRNQAVGNERCATRFNHGGTEYEEVYDRSGANPCGMLRGYWYYISSSMDFSSGTGFRGHISFYDTDNAAFFGVRSQISWSTATTIGNYVFQPTDYIAFRNAQNGDYPAIDCIFTAAIAMPYYLANSAFRFAFGVQETNYVVIYKFPPTSTSTSVTDLSGLGYTGELDDPLPAGQTFTDTSRLAIPTSVCSKLQPQTNVVGFFFKLALTGISGSQATLLTIQDSSAITLYQLYAAELTPATNYKIYLLDPSSTSHQFVGLALNYNIDYSLYFLFRTYSDSSHISNGMETMLYVKTPDNVTYYTDRVAYKTFVPASCYLYIGDTVSGITGTLKEFRMWYGTGVIPGLNQVWYQGCPESVGFFKGTYEPCFAGCSDINCIQCSNDITICESCNSGYYLYDDGSNPAYCASSCPYGFIADAASRVCTQCSASGKFLYSHTCIATCPTGWGADLHSVCGNCGMYSKVSYNNQCLNACPTGYGVTSNNCVDCSLNGTYAYNKTCVASCPYGYTADTSQHECVKCSPGLYYFNHTCLISCPVTTFAYTTSYECQPCFLGCDACTSPDNATCTACSEGYFLEAGYCGSGCPSSKYANSELRVCQQCQPPCVTCSQPNSHSCTNCPQDYLLFNGECLLSCPSTHYEGMLGESSLFQVPACLLRLGLEFNLALTTQARVIYINFTYSIANIVLAITQIIQIEIGNVQIDSSSYALTPVSDSRIKLQYLGDQYFPLQALLKVTIDLQSNLNYDRYQKFLSVTKSATIELKEIYPFTKTEIQVIAATSSFTGSAGTSLAGGQATASIASGGLSLSLVRMQIIGEVVQMLRFIDILMPPNVQDLFAETKYDPNSIVIQVDLLESWNQNIEDFNSSMPRVFEAYEVDLFFTKNYNNELSNIFILMIFTVFGAIVMSFLRKKLQSVTNRLKRPKTNAKKNCREHMIIFLHSLSRFLNRFDTTFFWNFALLFILSIFQPGITWSLVNIRYYSTIIEPPNSYAKATLGLAITCLIAYLSLMTFVFYAVISNFKYLIKTKENLRPMHMKPYRNLFEDFDNKNKLQLLFVPFSMVRSLCYALTIAFLNPYPLAQIIIIWSVTAIFILYYIVKQPLKDKWSRRITLVVELFGFGCMTIGSVLALIGKFIEIDPATRNEIGFAFIAFTITSTLAGGVLALVQVLGLIISIIQYFKKKHRQRRQVSPATLEEIHSKTSDTQDVPRRKAMLKVGSKGNITVNSNERFEKLDKSIKYFGTFSAQAIAQSPQGLQALEYIEKWAQEQNPSPLENTTRDIIQSPSNDKKRFSGGDRVSLFTSDH